MKTEKEFAVENLLGRIRNIQNKTKNVGWGIAKYEPMMNLGDLAQTISQYVVVVGHNVYRKNKTLFLEAFCDGTFSLCVMSHGRITDFLVDHVTADKLVSSLCTLLKGWFPELNAKVVTCKC